MHHFFPGQVNGSEKSAPFAIVYDSPISFSSDITILRRVAFEI